MLYTPSASSATTKTTAGHTAGAPCPVVGSNEPEGVGVGGLLAAGVGVGDGLGVAVGGGTGVSVGEGLGGTAVGVAPAAPDAGAGVVGADQEKSFGQGDP